MGNRHRVVSTLAVLVLIVWSLVAACGGSGDDAGANDGSGDSAGGGAGDGQVDAQQVFIDAGCAECHGENGEGDGTNQRTVLAGNQLFVLGQFQQRIRNGKGSAMPAYTAEQISDEHIELIFEWLTSQ